MARWKPKEKILSGSMAENM
jgi:hypothetical protein